jgi:hypothetical protein
VASQAESHWRTDFKALCRPQTPPRL